MFGRGKFQNGVLIDPKPQFAFDPEDVAKLEEFRTLIWHVSVSLSVFLGSHYEIQADLGALERLCSTALPAVQRGMFIHSHSRRHANQGQPCR